MIITPPPKLVQCEPVAFSWEGGQGPFSALIRGLVKDGSEHWVHSFEHVAVGNASLAWIVDFPVGSEIEISITNDRQYASRSAFRMRVEGAGTTSACIPYYHLPPRAPWFRRPFPIIMLVLAILLATLIVVYVVFLAFKHYRKHRKGEIVLPADDA